MIGVFFPVVGISQSGSYKENLKKNIALFESAKTANDFIYAANCFEKLAVTEKNQWLPTRTKIWINGVQVCCRGHKTRRGKS